MTGTASECQNCYPPKDEVSVSVKFVGSFFKFKFHCHPKGEVKSLRENGFLGGHTGGV
jgi:hypothetical protein